MKGIVLAGGEGRRLWPLTFEVPKPLITIRKKPLINYNLGLLAKYGVDDVRVIVRTADRKDYGHWYRMYWGDFPGMKIDVVEESEPMGTLGYTFHNLQRWMGGDDVFVTNGDDIKDIDLKAMYDFHRRTGASATLALMRMEKPDDYGTVLVRNDRVKEFLEKKENLPASLVSAGMYIITPSALEQFAAAAPGVGKHLMFERDMFPILAEKNLLAGFVAEGTFYDCGTFERWEKAIREV